jgi:diguanylate cyclase (GGDEF)-like protein
MRDETIVTVIHKVEDTGLHRRKKDACIVVIYGAELGRKYNIEGREMTIGRATTADICVSQDSVSRTHATVMIDESGVKIRDNESTNGTYVNDHKIHEAYLKDGDLIKVGRSIFKFLTGDNIESSYHEEIYRLSTVDGLTQIFNKRYFVETLERELSRARRYDRPLALMMFDIDHFKRCNDTYGHRAGDHVLRHMADIVRQRARKVDVVARYGGEEFAVILPEIDEMGAAQFAETVRAMVEQEEFSFEGRRIPLTISVGVAELKTEVANADDLIKRADARLYLAKQGGRNRVVWTDDPAMSAASPGR